MSMQPLLFFGDRRRQAIVDRATEASRRWRAGWVGPNETSFEVRCEPVGERGFASPVASAATSCWALECGDVRVAVLLLPHATFHACICEAGTLAAEVAGETRVGSMAEVLEEAVALSLASEVCGLEAKSGARVTRIAADVLEAWSLAHRAWTLDARTQTGRAFTLLVSASRMEAMAPARAMASGAIERRHQAVGDNAVTLRAVVGQASMSVQELASIAVDDVLVLDQSLSEPVALIAEASGSCVAMGNLGRAGARRGVKVAGIHSKEKHS